MRIAVKKYFEFKKTLPRRTYFSLGSVAFIGTIVVWHLITSLDLIKPYFLPSPTEIIKAAFLLFQDGVFWHGVKDSFYRVTVGYLLAVILAVPLGILVGSFKTIEALIEPMNNFIRYTPLPAFIPLIILWVGLGDLNQITVIFFGVFWSLIVMVADASASVPKELIDTAYTLGLKRREILSKVVFPYSLPGIYDSLRVAIGWAWSSLILAEVVGANTGIGHMIMESQRFLKTANVIFGIILVGILGVLLDYLFKMFYPILFKWSEKV